MKFLSVFLNSLVAVGFFFPIIISNHFWQFCMSFFGTKLFVCFSHFLFNLGWPRCPHTAHCVKFICFYKEAEGQVNGSPPLVLFLVAPPRHIPALVSRLINFHIFPITWEKKSSVSWKLRLRFWTFVGLVYLWWADKGKVTLSSWGTCSSWYSEAPNRCKSFPDVYRL